MIFREKRESRLLLVERLSTNQVSRVAHRYYIFDDTLYALRKMFR